MENCENSLVFYSQLTKLSGKLGPQCDLVVSTGFWLESERVLHACRKFRARSLLRPILAGIPYRIPTPKGYYISKNFRAARAQNPSVRQHRRLGERALHANAAVLTTKSYCGAPAASQQLLVPR